MKRGGNVDSANAKFNAEGFPVAVEIDQKRIRSYEDRQVFIRILGRCEREGERKSSERGDK